MNCNCLEEIKNRIRNEQDKLGIVGGIKSVECVQEAIIFGESTTLNTFTTFSVKIEGKKKEKTLNFHHKFCPFCGKEEGV